ncbi:MAG: septal ring lytic transglycosylase RlpA family protein [Treponema sp.]|jgi:rare lipoprotein A|nr:septal ring lytic transglycosylase RlpA family protein [Treponema sp.]
MKRINALMVISFGFVMLCSAQQIAGGAIDGIYREEGIASWYGHEFDGRATASGEIFDASQFTAAHASLPFGTLLTVTNKDNNKRVMVRVNDRGLNRSSRIIDISRAAAEQLDLISSGSAQVTLESIGTLVITSAAGGTTTVTSLPPDTALASAPEPAPTPVTQQPPPASSTVTQQPVSTMPTPGSFGGRPAEIKPRIPPLESTASYRLQIGAYKVAKNAVEVFDKLKALDLTPAYEKVGDFYRVVIPNVSATEVASIAEKIGSIGFSEAIIRQE